MHLYNFPLYKTVDFYNRAMEKVTENLSKEKGIIAVYQTGGINDPGISDLDIIAVFEDDFRTTSSPLSVLDMEEKYLFTHSVFGISKSFLEQNFRFSLFNNFKLLWGNEIPEEQKINPHSLSDLNRQTALEYLLSNAIARTVEKFYKLLSVRNILLSAKAIDYDLHLLNCSEDEPIRKNINELLKLRSGWFDNNLKNEKFLNWYSSFNQNLMEYTAKILEQYPLYISETKTYNFSRNIIVKPGNQFDIKISGFSLPASILAFNRKIRNANGLLNNFNFYIPLNNKKNNFLDERLRFYRSMLKYNRVFLPGYNPLSNTILTKICL